MGVVSLSVMGRMLAAWALTLSFGCGDDGSGAGPGESCFRTAQCADGLACVAGQCSSDVTGIGEGGVVPPFDAGPMLMPRDAGPRPDGGPIPDSGPPPMIDAGTDAGTTEMDAGPPDAGPMDAGLDAGVDSGL